LKQAAIFVSHSHPLQIISKQAFVTASHSNQLLFSCTIICPLHFSRYIFTLTICYIKGTPFNNKQLNIDSFLDCEGHHWIFISILQTTASDLLKYLWKFNLKKFLIQNLLTFYSSWKRPEIHPILVKCFRVKWRFLIFFHNFANENEWKF